METASGAVGDTICLDIRVDGFQEVMGMQYSLRWGTQALRFIGLENLDQLGLSDSHFSLAEDAVSEGYLALSWFDPLLQGISLPDGSVLYSLCLEVLNADAVLQPVSFSADPTRVELFDANSELFSAYSLINGGVYTGTGEAPRIAEACAQVGDCQGGQSIDIAMEPAGASYGFQWKKGSRLVATEEDLSGEIGGTYSLSVTDEQGAMASGLFYLLPAGLPNIIEAEIVNASCYPGADGAIRLNLGMSHQNLVLEWSNGATGTFVGGLEPGDYEVVITNLLSGCYYRESYTVGRGSNQPLAASVQWADCEENNGAITITEPPGGTYSFEWSHGETSLNADSLAPGQYTLTLDYGQGCTASQSFTIGLNDYAVVETATSECSDSNTADVTAAVQSGGTPPFIFEWSNGQVDTHAVQSTLMSAEIGIPYGLTITDASGCVQDAGPVVPQCEPLPLATLSVGERNSRTGKRVCVPVTAEALQGLDSLQFALQWDPAFLYLEGVQPGRLQQGFDLSQGREGLFRLAWGSGGSPLSIDSEELLFELCFTVIAPPGQAVPIGFLQPPLAYGSGQEPLSLQTDDGAVFLDSSMGEDALQLLVESGAAEAGEPICLDITTRNFTDVAGMQFSLRWDPDTLTLDSVLLDGELPLSPNSFNLQGSAEGRLSVQWLDNSLAGISLPGEARLFTACFTAGPDVGQSLLFFSSVPTLIEFTDGDVLLPVEVSNGRVEVLPEAVRPGDTDQDRQVNHYDLLNIGLGYGATGPERPDATLLWEKQPAPGWEQATPASGVNFKHLDTDGNGRIEAADTLAIVQNYGLEADPFTPEAPLLRAATTLMYVRPDTISPGEPAVLDIILGEDGMPAEEVYGIAFTVVYDTTAVHPGSARVMLRNSWLGILDEGLLLLQRDHPERGRLEVAITRTDGIDVSGYGPLAQLYITIQDVIFRRLPDHELLFDIEKIRLINSREELAVVIGQQSASMVLGAVNGTEESPGEQHIRVYPNPTPDVAHFGLPVERAELMSLDGRQLMDERGVRQLSLGHLPAGPYLLRLWKDGQASVHLLCKY